MLSELPFYNELNTAKTVKTCIGYGRSYNIGIIQNKDGVIKDPLSQLAASKPVIKDLFRDSLIEMKGFKY